MQFCASFQSSATHFGGRFLQCHAPKSPPATQYTSGSSRWLTLPSQQTTNATSEINQESSVTWDPEGILSSLPPSGGHFERRAREKAGSIAGDSPAPLTTLSTTPLKPVPGGVLQSDGSLGIRLSDLDKKSKAYLTKNLSKSYMPVDLAYPGLRVLHLDPPIFTVDAFFTPEECKHMREAAIATNKLVGSKVGAGNVHSTSSAAANSNRRTSTSVLVDNDFLQIHHPELQPSVINLQSRGKKLLGADEGRLPWGAAGELPAPRQYCYEGLQITRYEKGQYFMEHEDAFPVSLARDNGFNRHATLLVYLNDVQAGGATRFERLGPLSVMPEEGQALLFFPAFSDGTPDARTLHTATEAVDLKIVTQQWVARGFSAMSAAPSGVSKADSPFFDRNKKKNKYDSKKDKGFGGFGSSCK